MVLGLILFAATILALRRRGVGVLERYRYTIAAVGIVMTILPRMPVIGEQVNGAYLDIHVGSVSFQPAELGKVAIVIFLASYLHDNRQVLVTAGRRVLGLTIPPMKQFGPMLIVWGAAMGDAAADRRAGDLADVLRCVPGAAVCRHRALLVPVDRPHPVRARRVVRGRACRSRARARARLGTTVQPDAVQSLAAATSSPSRCSPRPTADCWGRGSTSRCCSIRSNWPTTWSCAARSCRCQKAT